MEIATVRGERRAPGGRHANARLRRQGLVPAVIYGHAQETETVALSLHDLLIALERMQHVIEYKGESDQQPRQYLIKAVQYDHLQKQPVHVDLMRVDQNERVHVKVPLELRGEPKGTHEGGVLVHVITDLEVECLLVRIPGRITVNVGHLVLGQSLHVSEIELPPDVRAVSAPDEIIAVVRARRGVHVSELEEAAEEGAEQAVKEPEIIGRTAKEDEPDGAGA